MAYKAYLNDDIKTLEKFCGEQALGYFKVLIKKREVDVSNLKPEISAKIQGALGPRASHVAKCLNSRERTAHIYFLHKALGDSL